MTANERRHVATVAYQRMLGMSQNVPAALAAYRQALAGNIPVPATVTAVQVCDAEVRQP
jgi:hypothetical protein